MNELIFICIFLFCGVSGFKEVVDATGCLAGVVQTAKECIDIKKELDEIREQNRKMGRRRTRRYSSTNDATSTLNEGNFVNSTIRGYRMLSMDEGKLVFGSLAGELNQSFKSLMRDGHRRTGDIIACRIPSSGKPENYMMVINNKIVGVGILAGNTHNAVIMIDPYTRSLYINSTECLYHKNRLISRAQQIDEQNGNDKETDLRYEQILNRLNCTLTGRYQFNYDNCNSQDLDLVLYWAYGYVEKNCISASFNGCSEYLTNTLFQISRFVDESGHL